MHKDEIHVSLTWHDDSKTLSWFVEHSVDGGRWDLWNEGTSMPSRGALDVFDELRSLLARLTDEAWSSTSRSSDVG